MSNYDAAWRDINNPSSSYYVPDANAAMECTTLTTNAKSLQDQITEWINREITGNSKEKKNIEKIIPFQQAKLDQYNLLLQRCTEPPPGTPPGPTLPAPTVPGQTVPDPAGTKKSNMFLWAGLAIGTFFILKKNKVL